MAKRKKTGHTLGALLTTNEDPKSLIKKLRSNNDEWQSVVRLKKFLEAKFPGVKIDFHELKGFTEVFRKRYCYLFKTGLSGEAKELWQVLGEGMDMSNEVEEALGYCLENNKKGIFCEIVLDRLSEGVNIKQVAKEAASHQTRNIISRLLSLLNDCGVSVPLNVVRRAVIDAAKNWEESKKSKKK